jgi:hypothetical protein
LIYQTQFSFCERKQAVAIVGNYLHLYAAGM